MTVKKKTKPRLNGNIMIIVLTAISAAVAAGVAAAVEGIKKGILNKRKGGTRKRKSAP